MPRGKGSKKVVESKSYDYNTQHPQRPDVGIEKDFKQKKSPVTYRYDSSLAPALDWDNNIYRELGNWLISVIEMAASLEPPHNFEKPQEFKDANGGVILRVYDLQGAVQKLKSISQPFLNWTGKAERLSFDVPTLPLFVHERLSTRAIIETLKSHKVGGEQLSLFSLFNDPQWSITDQILKAYEHQDRWVNRMILGDSLVVMNSLLQYEGMAGKVQMIYIDPPYGVKFGSNFQPFVRKRDVKHNDDDSLTREPEMVKAYRDTWELGLHSYLTYLRDRLLLARELLTESGSVFVQISDENVHHFRELMDEVFGGENFCRIIFYVKTGGLTSNFLSNRGDYIIWYCKNISQAKYNQLYESKQLGYDSAKNYNWLELSDGTRRSVTADEKRNLSLIPDGSRVYNPDNLTSQGNQPFDFEFEGKVYRKGWKTHLAGLQNLALKNRIHKAANSLGYVRYLDDFPVIPITSLWLDTGVSSFGEEKLYVVQTGSKTIERCLLMTTDPGDLVLDLTCGSGTTAYVAEQWGRRWITCDISRVPLSLARQRLLTATFPYYELNNQSSGPAGGFVYKRKQNKKGEEIGGIVPHITLKSIANDETPEQEILVDRPEQLNNIVRVAGPFVIEGTIPPPVEMENQQEPETEAVEVETTTSFSDRLLRALQQSPVLHLPGNQTVTFTEVRQPAQSQTINAEAIVAGQAVAFLFGLENGAVGERTVWEAAREALDRQYQHLYVIGFAINAKARQFIDHAQETMGVPTTYIQATPDLLMGDLLKNMRSSQIFSVCGLPEIKIHQMDGGRYQVELLGLDVFDPVTMDVDHRQGKDVPAWFLDTDYNGLCFYVRQAFFPRTSAWEGIKKALGGSYEDSVWEHLAGTTSAPFEPGEHREIAVKAIDDRGNELLVVKELD